MKEFLRNLIAPALVALLVASVANGAVYQWSPTAANNGSADPSINFSEGMSPSSVNDSARALMARVANWRDDFSGLLGTSGISTGLVVVTNQGFPSTPLNGQLLTITPNITNAAGVTLVADGGTAYPIQSSAGVGIASGTMIAGSPYMLKFSTANNAWMLLNFFGNPFTVPLGAMIPYTGDTAPNSNFILPGGQCLSRTTYASYFALVGTRFGACDGVTTFAAPDMRGRAPFGIDNLATGSAGRMTSSSLGCGTSLTSVGATCANSLQSHTQTELEMAPHQHTGITDMGGVDHTHPQISPPGTNGQFSGLISPNNGWLGAPSNSGTTGSASAYLHQHNFTTNFTGGGVAFPIVPHLLGVSYILRVI